VKRESDHANVEPPARKERCHSNLVEKKGGFSTSGKKNIPRDFRFSKKEQGKGGLQGRVTSQ